MFDTEDTQDPEEAETQNSEEEEETPELSTAEEPPKAETPAETPKPAKPSNEIKVVIILKDHRAMIGVQSPDCDPVYETMEGDLKAVLEWVPKTVEVAKQKWATTPRYPKANLPEPPPPPAPAPRAAATKSARATEKPKAQPSFF